MQRQSSFVNLKTNSKDVKSFKFHLQIKCKFFQILSKQLHSLEILILRFTWEDKKSRKAKTYFYICELNERNNCYLIISPTTWNLNEDCDISGERIIQINETGQRTGIETNMCLVEMNKIGRGIVFSTNSVKAYEHSQEKKILNLNITHYYKTQLK